MHLLTVAHAPRFAPRQRPFASSAALFAGFLACLLAQTLTASAARAQGGLALLDGAHAISELEIGDDLFVRLPLMLPTAPLELHVLDEAGQSVAALAPLAVPADPLEPVPLWLRTGVVGCDVPSAQDVSDYHFRDFQQAAAHLAGRTFSVELRFASGAPIQGVPLPIKARPNSGRGTLYFSDASGCPRTVFSGSESVYLSGYRSYFPHGATVFLVDPQQPTDASGQVLELRPGYLFTPQVISSSVATGDWTHRVWSGPSTLSGAYGAIVGGAGGRSGYALGSADGGVGALEDTYYEETNVHGITILDVECADCDPIHWKWGFNSP
ncbi:MAG: hypothetical protein AAGF23_17580 [Acidobacteriota bacterium]